MAEVEKQEQINTPSVFSLNKQREVLRVEFHEKAESEARKIVDHFSVSLIVQSKLVAYQKRAEQVLSSHVQQALDHINRNSARGWAREITIAVGSAFFGAFVPGFITELGAGRTAYVAVYTILGIFGIIMVAWGLQHNRD